MPAPLRVLYASRWWPEPADNGSRLRAWAQLRALAAAGHRVSLLSFAREDGSAPAAQMRQWCESVAALPRREYDPTSWRARLGYLSPRPRSLVDVYSPAMAAAFAGAAARCDVVVACTIEMAEYATRERQPPAVLDELQLGVFLDETRRGSAAARARARLRWRKLARHTARILPRFAACTVASEVERTLVRSAAPAYDGVHVLPNAVDLEPVPPVERERAENRILFAGASSFAANREGIDWFVRRVLPHLQRRRPTVEVWLTGGSPPPLAAAGVRHLGWVEDIRAVVASATVSIAPILTGAGTRLKILEAMALGTPVVATSKGAEGLEAIHGVHLLIADDEEVFAAQVGRLLDDAGLRRRLAANAHALVRERYDATEVGCRFVALVERIAAARNPGGIPG